MSFLGREIFVGVSQRTNLNGALAVASAFPEFYVTPINVPRKVLHLKSCVSMAGPDILAVSSTPEAQEILRVSFFFRETKFAYREISFLSKAYRIGGFVSLHNHNSPR